MELTSGIGRVRPYLVLATSLCILWSAESVRADLVFMKPLIADQVFLEGGIVGRDYNFSVNGSGPTKILKITPSCGCTVAALDRAGYDPGDQGRLVIHFNPEGRLGMQGNHIDIDTECGGKKQTIELGYRVNVVQAIVAQPEIVFWLVSEKPTSRQVLVRSHASVKPQALELEGKPEHFTVEQRWDEQQDVWFLAVTPKEPIHPIKEAIRLKMTVAGGKQYESTLFALIK